MDIGEKFKKNLSYIHFRIFFRDAEDALRMGVFG